MLWGPGLGYKHQEITGFKETWRYFWEIGQSAANRLEEGTENYIRGDESSKGWALLRLSIFNLFI